VIVTTFNVNSVRARAERVAGFLAARAPDVLCLQETKVEDALFPHELFGAQGYHVRTYGQKTYNGVAIAVREGLEASGVHCGLGDLDEEAGRRLMALSVGGVRIVNVYVVNGQEVDSAKYALKLRWLRALAAFLRDELTRHEKVLVVGDFNIAPADLDVHDPARWEGKILCSAAERAALADITGLGFSDVFRQLHPEAREFSWWDYRMLGFPKNLGLRIDLMLATTAVVQSVQRCWIDRDERKGKNASDHAPVMVELA
jgi:exodeoxyribonuclease-3